jgi:hypothetical protein
LGNCAPRSHSAPNKIAADKSIFAEASDWKRHDAASPELHLSERRFLLRSLGVLISIDRFMSEARSVTNIIGNALAAVVVAKASGEFDVSVANTAYEEAFGLGVRFQLRGDVSPERPFEDVTMVRSALPLPALKPDIHRQNDDVR